jgi:hypothetical protein
VDEDHRRAAAVVLVVKLDGAGVLGPDSDDWPVGSADLILVLIQAEA